MTLDPDRNNTAGQSLLKSDELDYCMVLDMTLNDPHKISNSEMARLVDYFHSGIHTSAIQPKYANDSDTINLTPYTKMSKSGMKGGISVLFRITIQGNPKLLKWVQKFNCDFHFSYDADIFDLPMPPEDDIEAFKIDKPYYLHYQHKKTLAKAIPLDADNHIYSILFYDCPTSWLSFEKYDYFARRQIFVTYAKSTIPDDFDGELVGYDKVRISWSCMMDGNNSSPSQCSADTQLIDKQEIEFGNDSIDVEAELDWAKISNLMQQFAEEHEAGCSCKECVIL